MRLDRLGALLASGLALGCNAAPASTPGVETGPCVEGDCFDGLMCLSNLCVDPDESPAETGDEGGDGNDVPNPGDDDDDSNPGDDDDDSDPGDDDDDDDDVDPDDGNEDTTDDGSEETGPGPLTGCDAIDVVFVIDNSGSMQEEQARLLAALPDFVEDIDNRLGPADTHYMVVDTDAWPFELCDQACSVPAECIDANGQCNIFGPGNCNAICGASLTCGSYPCGGLDQGTCDETLGAGVTSVYGLTGEEQSCSFASGGRYIDGSEPDLLDALACSTQVGIGSLADPERPMEALVQAIAGDGDVDSCNDGFLRDGALLIAVFITDEDDANGDSAGNPASWHTALLQAKGNDPDAIVVLGMFGDGDLPFSQCVALPENGGAETSQRLRSFMQLWGNHGVFGSVCDSTYDDAFVETVDVAEGICDAL